ncbi:MAG: DUF937 domain-containing protein, partial [Gemmatimonadota bacterium]
MSLANALLDQLGDSGLASLGQAIGSNPDATKAAATATLPLLFSALAKNAGTDDGAAALDRALERDHDGSILDNLAGGFSSSMEQDGNGILKHVLGGRRETTERGLAQASGLDSKQSAQMLATLAPLVMGALGKQKRSQGLDAGALAGMLQGERGQNKSQLGGLAALIDQDGDGGVADDLLGGIG